MTNQENKEKYRDLCEMEDTKVICERGTFGCGRHHVCRCDHCQPEYFTVPKERQGEGHIAVRWGDIKFRVFIDDWEVSVACFEALAGPGGWVLFYSKPENLTHLCTCGKGACSQRYEGDDVRIERMA